MLLTITTTHSPATDLGYLLHKNPARVQRFAQAFGSAYVYYPVAREDVCTAALLLEIDPVGLARGRRGPEDFVMAQYVNDRPYVASSFLSVAMADVFGTAMNGRSSERPDLAGRAIPMEATVSALPSHGGTDLLERLFGPLGYEVTATEEPLDPTFPEWGPSPYFSVTLRATKRLQDLLTHLYVLIPVLDNKKHYWVGDDEVEKLLRRGQGWLASHPEKELISRRYLKFRRSLTRVALERLAEVEESESPDPEEADDAEEKQPSVETKIRLHEQRLDEVMEVISQVGPKRVLDLGCGSGLLLQRLMREKSIQEIAGMDVSYAALEHAERRLKLDRLPEARRQRVKLLHGSLTYRDRRLEGYDLAVASEVVEHLDPFRLDAFEQSIFGFAKPVELILTTPNREYNDLFESLAAGNLRHRDHRFEWTRGELGDWARRVGEIYGYGFLIRGVGPEDAARGSPSQLVHFSRRDAS